MEEGAADPMMLDLQELLDDLHANPLSETRSKKRSRVASSPLRMKPLSPSPKKRKVRRRKASKRR